MHFIDRVEAGQLLAAALAERNLTQPVVLGLPRGGVPVAAEVARVLDAPMDVVVVRKLGVPGRRELALGAIGEQGALVVNERIVRAIGIGQRDIDAIERRERAELERRVQMYRGARPPVDVAGRTVIVVDDGVATGSTALAACQVVRVRGADRVVFAAPVGPAEIDRIFADDAGEVVCLHTPYHFQAVGQFYDDFTPVTDDEVVALLRSYQGGP